jgi:DNA-binding IscR family transcriptional regulator
MMTSILHLLVQSGLVVSVRGVLGGYRLARGANEISLVEIIEAVEGPVQLTYCCHSEADELVRADKGSQPRDSSNSPLAGHGSVATALASENESGLCRLEPTCRIREPIRRVNQGINDYLRGISLADMVTGLIPIEISTTDRGR